METLTYAIFVDQFRQVINDLGKAGAVLQTGLVSGYTYRKFLAHLLSTKTLVSFYGFENEDLLFQSITNKMKFGILTLTGRQRPVEKPWFTANIRQPDEMGDPKRTYSLSAGEIEAINPNTHA